MRAIVIVVGGAQLLPSLRHSLPEYEFVPAESAADADLVLENDLLDRPIAMVVVLDVTRDLSALHALGSNGRSQELPTIVIAPADFLPEAVADGAARALSSPVSLDVLGEALAECARKSRAGGESPSR